MLPGHVGAACGDKGDVHVKWAVAVLNAAPGPANAGHRRCGRADVASYILISPVSFRLITA